MKRLILSLLLLAGASVLAAPAPVPRAKRDRPCPELSELQGEWVMLDRSHRDLGALGRKERARGAGHWLVIRGDRIRWHAPGGEVWLAETIRLHAGAGPRGIDFTC